MSEQHLSTNQNEINPGFNFARFEKGTRFYTIILDKDLFDGIRSEKYTYTGIKN